MRSLKNNFFNQFIKRLDIFWDIVKLGPRSRSSPGPFLVHSRSILCKSKSLNYEMGPLVTRQSP